MTSSRGTIPGRALAAALALSACTRACSTHEAAPPASGERSTTAPVVPRTTAKRGTVIGGEKVARVVAWPQASTLDADARAQLLASVGDRLDASPIPVLAPPQSGRSTLSLGASWYALTVHGEGYLLHTHGSGEARLHPHVRVYEPTHPMRGGAGYLTRNEEVWSASWIEHGVAYGFEIECDRRVVPWCDDEREVQARLESLVYVGGRGGAR
ncbi:MAG: hypothetical protein U0168_11430 [Nannocystaceae bacterium]